MVKTEVTFTNEEHKEVVHFLKQRFGKYGTDQKLFRLAVYEVVRMEAKKYLESHKEVKCI